MFFLNFFFCGGDGWRKFAYRVRGSERMSVVSLFREISRIDSNKINSLTYQCCF